MPSLGLRVLQDLGPGLRFKRYIKLALQGCRQVKSTEYMDQSIKLRPNLENYFY